MLHPIMHASFQLHMLHSIHLQCRMLNHCTEVQLHCVCPLI